MDLERLITALGPLEVRGGAPTDITDLAYDTREVRPGALFFCAPGERIDRHDLAGEAVERGAAALVVERPLDLRVPQLVVPSARAAMAVAADEFFGRPTEELVVAGVTGTNGKTTTAYLLYSILDTAGMRPGLIGTIESRVGGEARPAVRTTPEAIDLQRTFREMVDAGDRSVVLEATSHGSVLGRLDRVRFDGLAFTNLTQDHLDFHGSMDEYYEAKRRLFAEHEPPPPAAVNVDDPWGKRLADELRRLNRAPLLTYGLGDDADITTSASWGSIVTPEPIGYGGILLRAQLHGRFNMQNMLAAVAVSRLIGIPDESVATGVERLPGVPGRFESVQEGQPFTVLVDYAHTPDSLANVLRAARELTAGQLICVFGCGGDRDRGKRPEMGRIASELADIAIVTSDNPRSEDPLAIIDDILAGVSEDVQVEPDRRAAIVRAIEEAGERDVVVIAGKGHEQGQEFADRKIPFDDREVAREALRNLRAPA
ncbi:MAG TPA: UDP-N-acetylmuramoyl-L-alanyl-D-glutamate--2,6-diaminopimelate ligase [Gaiellaceae bacterium]|nr:UDP-N-acetylmuramoyl-L-alanyl-D-glutamate--2,6-diaminopimelate ligase [Gaiellaceae bacterium]